MYLVDSTVWIEFFRRKGSAAVKNRLRPFIASGDIAISDIIFMEVLKGAKTRDELNLLKSAFADFPFLPFDEKARELAAEWAFELARSGLTLPLTDIMIAAVAHKRATILHLDADFRTLANRIKTITEVQWER